MLFKSQSLAKIILVASVAITAISGYQLKEWSNGLDRAKSSVQTAKQGFRSSTEAYTTLSEELVPDEKSLSLQEAVSKTVLDVYNLRVSNGVVVTTASPARGGSATTTSMENLATNVPNTESIKSVRINIRGSYSEYLGLLNYIKELQQNPISVVYLEINDLSFELSIRIYGESLAL